MGDRFFPVDVDSFPVPGPAKRLVVSAPSIIHIGKSFDAHVVVVDESGNPTNRAPGLEILIDGKFSKRLRAKTNLNLL